jgi:N-acetylglucosamine-6-phosphate deacetylase
MDLNKVALGNYLIKTDNLYTPDKIEGVVYIEVNDSKIEQISFTNPQSNLEVLDLTGHIIAPGFIDVHIHGYGGNDALEGTIEAISSIAKGLATRGVTSFLPTTVAATVPELEKVISVSESFDSIKGTKPLGFHLEGPFLSTKEPGAMDPKLFDSASTEKISALLKSGKVIMMTIAPEVDKNLDVIEYLVSQGINVSLGHTATDYETAVKAFAKGATSITHFFNAMKPFQHREPGLVGAGILYPFYLQFIGDGVHTHKATIKIMSQLFKDRLVLITDAIMAAGLDKPGTYKLGDFNIIVDETSARLENGTLAGSILTMDRGVRNLVEFGNLNLSEAFTCASQNPAKSIMISDRGSIKTGNFADFVVLDKNTLQVEATIREGNTIYAKDL